MPARTGGWVTPIMELAPKPVLHLINDLLCFIMFHFGIWFFFFFLIEYMLYLIIMFQKIKENKEGMDTNEPISKN